jgi:hypothetical protein
MMASHADAHPDSIPEDADDSPEQVQSEKDRTEQGSEDSPGDFAGTAGAGGENKVQDQGFER